MADPSGRGDPSRHGGGRGLASVSLAVIGAVLALLGAVALYARTEVIDAESFAGHAAEALTDDEVREVVSIEVVVQLLERGSPDLVAARPVLESVVGTVVETRQFRDVFRSAAIEANRLLFVRDRSNVALDLADSVEIVRFALRSVSPELADQIPARAQVELAKLSEQQFAHVSLQIADVIRVLGLLVPALALLALAGSVLAARDRRSGVLRVALALAAAGTALAIAMVVIRDRLLAGVIGGDELTDEQLQGAIGGILDAFFGGLFGWALLLAFGGVLVASSAAALDPERAEDPIARLRRRLLERPRTTAGRALRGGLAIVAGLFVALEPELALAVAGLLGGAYLVYFGAGELLLLLQPPEPEPGAARDRRRRELVRTGAIAAAVVAAIVVAVVVVLDSGDGPAQGRAAAPADGCNGSRELCRMRLNEVAFAGTHNSFSAADSPGWLIANQRHAIERQLEDGIRLLLLDPHWGVEDERGRVRTDFEAEDRDRNRVANALPPETLAAVERLAGSLGLRGGDGGEPRIYLCHTVCELGATSFDEALAELREFLDRNPGEVVILFIEPYVPPAAIEDAFERAGLLERVATLDRDAPLPTLGELVREDRRLVVLTERDADGTVPWYLDGFSFVQDTPLGATEPGELSCEPNRGGAHSPILMLNHWADVFPPRRGANAEFQTREELLGRARRCERRRGLPVGLLAVDHYDLGEVVGAVEELNRERIDERRRRMGR